MLKEKKYDKNKIIEKIYNYFEDNNLIVAVYIFGSLIRGNFNNNSDVDLALMLKNKDKIETFEYKLKVIKELESILNMEVDVVVFSQVSLRLQHQILKGELLISQNEEDRVKREKNSNKKFLDMKYFHNMYEKNMGGNFRDGK